MTNSYVKINPDSLMKFNDIRVKKYFTFYKQGTISLHSPLQKYYSDLVKSNFFLIRNWPF